MFFTFSRNQNRVLAAIGNPVWPRTTDLAKMAALGDIDIHLPESRA